MPRPSSLARKLPKPARQSLLRRARNVVRNGAKNARNGVKGGAQLVRNGVKGGAPRVRSDAMSDAKRAMNGARIGPQGERIGVNSEMERSQATHSKSPILLVAQNKGWPGVGHIT